MTRDVDAASSRPVPLRLTQAVQLLPATMAVHHPVQLLQKPLVQLLLKPPVQLLQKPPVPLLPKLTVQLLPK